MATWIALGTIACWFLTPTGAWVFLAFALIMVGVVLRKLVCTNCYYYDKWCSTGWGKLAALMFSKGDEDKFSTSLGQKLAPITYGILTVVPIIFLVTALFDTDRLLIQKILVLVLLIAVSFYSSTSDRKKSCADCRMRPYCPGSAVKESD